MSDHCSAALTWVFSSHGVAPLESAAKITEGWLQREGEAEMLIRQELGSRVQY